MSPRDLRALLASLALLPALALAACPAERGAPCTDDDACAEELACEPRGDGTSLCVPVAGLREVGEPCREDALCGPGGVCFPGARAPAGSADGAVSLCLVDDGQLCFDDEECRSGACNSSCLQSALCEAGVSCPCTRDDDCSDGERCAGNACGRTCEPAGERGDACVTRAHDGPCAFAPFFKGCGADLLCAVRLDVPSDGVCLPREGRAPDELCNRDEECASGACVERACT